MCLLLYRISPLIPKPALEFKPPALSESHPLPTKTQGHRMEYGDCARLCRVTNNILTWVSEPSCPFVFDPYCSAIFSIPLNFKLNPFFPSKCSTNTTLRAVLLTTSTKTNQTTDEDSELTNVEFGKSIAVYTVTSSRCFAPYTEKTSCVF